MPACTEYNMRLGLVCDRMCGGGVEVTSPLPCLSARNIHEDLTVHTVLSN